MTAGPRRGRAPTRRPGAGPRRPIDLATFRDDPLYPKLTRAVGAILTRGKVVAPIEVLVEMQLLTRRDIDDWRRGLVPYLERVIRGNLTRLLSAVTLGRSSVVTQRQSPSVTMGDRRSLSTRGIRPAVAG